MVATSNCPGGQVGLGLGEVDPGFWFSESKKRRQTRRALASQFLKKNNSPNSAKLKNINKSIKGMYSAADPNAVRKSHHTLKQPAVVAQDIQAALAFIGDGPLRSLDSYELRSWCTAQGWTPGYYKAIIERVAAAIAAQTPAQADAIRAAMLHRMEILIPYCRSLVLGQGPSSKTGGSAGTVAIRHPDTGELLDEIDHAAIQGYLKIIAGLCGLSTDKSSVENTAGESLTAAMLAAAEVRAKVVQAEPSPALPDPLALGDVAGEDDPWHGL